MCQSDTEAEAMSKMGFIKAQKCSNTLCIASFCNAEKFHFWRVSAAVVGWHINRKKSSCRRYSHGSRSYLKRCVYETPGGILGAETVVGYMSISLFCDFIIAHNEGKCNNRRVKVCIQFGIQRLQNHNNGDRISLGFGINVGANSVRPQS